MIALLAIHLGTNYMAVRSVSMRTLNRQRANLVFSDYLDQLIEFDGEAKRSGNGNLKFPTPEEISIQERIFERDGVLRWKGGKVLGYCQIGVDFRRILDLLSPSNSNTGSYITPAPQSLLVSKLLDIFKDEDYIMYADTAQMTFLIVLKESSNAKTQLKAWMHALLLTKQVARVMVEEDESLIEAIERTSRDVNVFVNAGDVWRELEGRGWDLETGAVETRSGTRISIS